MQSVSQLLMTKLQNWQRLMRCYYGVGEIMKMLASIPIDQKNTCSINQQKTYKHLDPKDR